MERIEIFTSKKKNIFLLFLVIIFLAVGIFCFLNANELSNIQRRIDDLKANRDNDSLEK